MRYIRITAVSAAMVLVGLTNRGPAFARPPLSESILAMTDG